jgi:uncharacterized protein (UPF0276 family)
MELRKDYVGLGLRIDIAVDIGKHLAAAGDVECLEVIAEDYYRFPRTAPQIQGLAFLAKTVPLSIHGVTLGMASASPVGLERADGMARLMEWLEPVCWSEHLSFVRSAGMEIGHLAGPPRSAATVDGAARNIEALARHVGQRPVVENVASLIRPPCSAMPETKWLSAILAQSNAYMLLDLHNLYANATNEGLDPRQMMLELPLHRVRQVHLAGGMNIPSPGGGTRLLDDHVHEVPDAVFDLLELLTFRTDQNLMVIIERDGRYPEFDAMLAEVRAAKAAVSRGRARRDAERLVERARTL